MGPLLNRLAPGRPLVADGAIGTLLFQRGLDSGRCPETVNLENPEQLEEIARLYLDAGAQIIQTNTFGASPLKLSHYGLDAKTDEINRAAVRAVRHAVGDGVYVSGSCGPCGRILRPYGDTEPTTVSESFKRQVSALLDAGVDVICVETMVDLSEAALAVKAAKAVSPETPVMATMTFDATKRGFRTLMGVGIDQAAVGLQEAGADIIGSNCGNGIDNMVRIAAEFQAVSSLPIVIQSNAGLPQTRGGSLVYDETPDYMAGKARAMVDAGVAIIGGCCGTTPEHILAFRRMVDSRVGPG